MTRKFSLLELSSTSLQSGRPYLEQIKKMKRFSAFSLMIAAVILLAGCTAGASAPPPPNVTAVAGDSSITVSWNAAPGVEYWLFFAPAASVTPENCASIPGCQIITNAVSPVVLSAPLQPGGPGFTTNGADGSVGLTNGQIYSITVNGRTSGGPGGSGSPSISAVPRLAGSSWSAGTALAASDLRGMTHGTAFVAVGTGGGVFSSPDGINWTAPPSFPVSTDLNAVTVSGTTYVAAGAGGVILTSPDTITWTPQQSLTISSLNGVATSGAGYVAVGDGGTIVTSSNGGLTWSTATSGTLNNLYGVAYANGKYVAVGHAGTLLTSTDGGGTWLPAVWTTPPPTLDLKSVAYGGAMTTNGQLSGVNTFVAIGSAGTLVTSVDGGATWTYQTTPITPLNLNAVTFGHQFVAVGNNGAVYTSTDGINWSSQASGTSSNIYAIAHGLYDYSAVGATGLNLHSM